MRAIRIGAGAVALVLAFSAVACTSSSDTVEKEPASSTTTSSPSETSDVDAANARIAELEAELFTATSTTVPLTTTTTLPKEFTVTSHEAGEYVIDPTITSVRGSVSDPDAEIEVNNQVLAVGDFSDPWWDFGPPEDENWSIPLTEGRNMLMFTATFPDSTTIIDDPVVYYDPTLTEQLGILIDYRPDEPRTMTFDTGTEHQQDAGGGITVEGTATYWVADDAVFKLEAADTTSWSLVGSDEFFALLDFIDNGSCALCLDDGCCPARCIWASWNGSDGLEFGIYLDANSDIQQLTQLHLRN